MRECFSSLKPRHPLTGLQYNSVLELREQRQTMQEGVLREAQRQQMRQKEGY